MNALVASDGTCFEWHGTGQPVVLIHGMGLNRHMWQWQIPALSKDHRVLIYDLLGHGQSPAPPIRPNLKLFSQQLRQLLDEQNVDCCTVIGFSLGGMIARRFAMDHPERLSALVILNSPHTRSDSEQEAINKRVEQVDVQGQAATVEVALARWFTDNFRLQNPETIDLVRQWVLANNPAVYASCYRVLAEGVSELIAPNPPIACRTLVATSEQDSGQPSAMAHAIAQEIPKSETVILPELKHMGLTEAPGTYNQMLLSFLNQVNEH